LQEQSGAQQNTPTEINNDFQPSTITSISSLVAKQLLAKSQKASPLTRQNELLELACDFLKDSKTAGEEDEYLTIAKVWGNKLKFLHPIQRKRAEKAINDILFEAYMGNLQRGSVQINCQHQDSGLLSSGMTDNSSTPEYQYSQPKTQTKNVLPHSEQLHQKSDAATFYTNFSDI
jgi:hypothetical protein